MNAVNTKENKKNYYLDRGFWRLQYFLRIRRALTVGLRREVDIEKILNGFLTCTPMDIFSSKGNIEKYCTVNMLMSLRTH